MAVENPLAYVSESIAPPTGPRSADRSYRLYVAAGTVLLAIILTAFSTRYFVRPPGATPLPIFIHVHALLFTTWVSLFVVQAALVQLGHSRYHRQVGVFAIALAALIVMVGFYTAIEGARRGHNPGGAPNAFAFMIVPWADIMLFAGFIFAAWHFRKRRELHMRLMLFATLGGFLWPAITRLPFLPGGPQRVPYMFAILLAVLLIPAVTSLLARQRVHWLDWTSAVVIFASLPMRRFIGVTESWQKFAAWMVS